MNELGLGGESPVIDATTKRIVDSYANTQGRGILHKEAERTAQRDDANIIAAGIEAETAFALGAGGAATINGDVTKSEAQARKDEVEYVTALDNGIRNGLTMDQIDQITTADTNISMARRQELYSEVATTKYNTNESEIAEKQQQQADATINALQAGVGGMVAASLEQNGSGLSGALNGLTGQSEALKQPEPTNAFGISNDVFAMLRGSMVDLGNTAKAHAETVNFASGLTIGPELRQRETALA